MLSKASLEASLARNALSKARLAAFRTGMHRLGRIQDCFGEEEEEEEREELEEEQQGEEDEE